VFDKTRQIRPFYTEFCVFQGTAPDEEENGGGDLPLPDLVCSKISRVYNYEGNLKQGCTSFFTFKRFGTDKDEL